MSERFNQEGQPFHKVFDLSPEELQRAEQLAADFDPDILPGQSVTDDEKFRIAVRETKKDYVVGDTNNKGNVAKATEILQVIDFELAPKKFGGKNYDDVPVNVDEQRMTGEQARKAERILFGSTLNNAELVGKNTPNPTDTYNRVGSKFFKKETPSNRKPGFFSKFFGG
jgi:hypothetical protein